MDGDINVEILHTSTRQQTWRALTRLGGQAGPVCLTVYSEYSPGQTGTEGHADKQVLQTYSVHW